MISARMSEQWVCPDVTDGIWFLLLSKCLIFILLSKSVVPYKCLLCFLPYKYLAAYPFSRRRCWVAFSIGRKLLCLYMDFGHIGAHCNRFRGQHVLTPKNSVLHLDEVSSDSFSNC